MNVRNIEILFKRSDSKRENKQKKPPSTQQINSQRADHTFSKRENRNNSLNMFSITDAQKM